MKLHTISTGSRGNAYLLKASTGEILMIECGVGIKQIKQALNFDFSRVSGAIATHSHLDHSKSISDVLNNGVNVWASEHTHEARGTTMHHRACFFKPMVTFSVGTFNVMPFDVKHDVPTVGFLIKHPECGVTGFITDTYYCPHRLRGLNNLIIEANFSKAIIDRKMREGRTEKFLRDRIIRSHLSLEYCIELLQANDLSKVNHIVLIHLSDSNSHERQFKQEVIKATGKNVTVASNGLEIEFNKTAF